MRSTVKPVLAAIVCSLLLASSAASSFAQDSSPGETQATAPTEPPAAAEPGVAGATPGGANAAAVADPALQVTYPGGPSAGHQAEHFSLLDPHTWPFTLIPVPEVATDPNQGTTVGLLPVFLFNNERHEIRSILAPDINYNTNMGPGGTFRYLAYPSEDTQWYAIAGAQENIARKVDLLYSTGRTRAERWSFDGRFYFERDPTERFFGIGNDTRMGGQSNFTTEQLYGEARLGVNLTPQLQIALVEKPRYVRILRGALGGSLPFTGALYPDVKGLAGGTDMMNRLMISYDTRDSVDIPRDGGLIRLFGGVSDRNFLSSVSYTQFGGEFRRYVPLGDRVTLASHLYLQYTPAGHETPFWAMGRLGGEDSLLWGQQTLRGYGTGRFVDNNLSVANLEMRTRVYERNMFDTHGILELAPFFEAGRVFHTPAENPLNRMHPVGGIGIRGIAEPFVVGYVDIGYGGEGTAVFSGINYPF